MFEGEKEILFTVEMSIHELYLLFAAPTTGQSISSYEVSRFTCRVFSYRKLDKCGKKKKKTGIQTLVARGEAKLRALSNLTKDLPSFCCFRRLCLFCTVFGVPSGIWDLFSCAFLAFLILRLCLNCKFLRSREQKREMENFPGRPTLCGILNLFVVAD